MNLADLGNIGEFAGAIGVIGSLIYGGYQIRQFTDEDVKEWWDSKVTPFTDGFRNAIDCTPNAKKNWDPRTLRVLTGEDN